MPLRSLGSIAFTALTVWVLLAPRPAAADVIVFTDGRRIETPRAVVEGTQVHYTEGGEVRTVPHAQVLEIHRSESTGDPPPPAVYRLAFTDGRVVEAQDVTDAGDAVQFTKYGVRVTIDKSALTAVTRVSGHGEAIAPGPGAPAQPPAAAADGGEEALRRMSEESRARALYNAVVDEQALAAEADRKRAAEIERCQDRCLREMLACRRECSGVLETLAANQVSPADPTYAMVKKEVVAPCVRRCIDTEAGCRRDCVRSAAPPGEGPPPGPSAPAVP